MKYKTKKLNSFYLNCVLNTGTLTGVREDDDFV